MTNNTKRKPTPQQRDFVDALVDKKTGHLCLRARAGTGKTTTILDGVDAYAAAHPDDEVVVCAYNKAIADEVSEKLKARGHGEWKIEPRSGRKIPPRVQAATAHSLGFGLVRFVFRLTRDNIDDKKVRKIIDGLTEGMNAPENKRIYQSYGAQINELVHKAKQEGFGFFGDRAIGDVHAWHWLADHYDVNGLDDTSEADAVVAAAQHVYRLSLDQTDVVDFDDMILFPLVKNIRVKFTKQLVVVDEAQDLSRARQALIRKFLAPGGRMVIVGDDRQAIYAFSGADSAALDNQISAFGARVLPLTVTWRCPKKVVELAQTLVPDIEAAPTASLGVVLHIPIAVAAFRTQAIIDMHTAMICREANGMVVSVPVIHETTPDEAKCRCTFEKQEAHPWYANLTEPLTPTDAILCRNTAPLVSLAYQLIRAKIPCKVEGRSIGEGLKALAQRWKVSTVDALLKRLDAYAERERQKALAKGNEAKADEVGDRVQTLKEICGAVTAAGKHGVADVVAFIDELFADGAKGVTVLATAHRSKGREWKRVFLLEYSTRCPSKAARQPWQLQQEYNLMYVMLTRAQETLVFVE